MLLSFEKTKKSFEVFLLAESKPSLQMGSFCLLEKKKTNSSFGNLKTGVIFTNEKKSARSLVFVVMETKSLLGRLKGLFIKFKVFLSFIDYDGFLILFNC